MLFYVMLVPHSTVRARYPVAIVVLFLFLSLFCLPFASLKNGGGRVRGGRPGVSKSVPTRETRNMDQPTSFPSWTDWTGAPPRAPSGHTENQFRFPQSRREPIACEVLCARTEIPLSTPFAFFFFFGGLGLGGWIPSVEAREIDRSSASCWSCPFRACVLSGSISRERRGAGE